VASVSFTRDGQCILVGLTSGESVRLFDKSSGELLQEYSGNKNKASYRIEAVLDHTDRRVLAGSEDGCVFIWDLVDAKQVGKLDHGLENVPIHSLSFHPEQSRLCTAAKDFVYFWGI
jgi:mitogen-activated protein kinase organizer 1